LQTDRKQTKEKLASLVYSKWITEDAEYRMHMECKIEDLKGEGS